MMTHGRVDIAAGSYGKEYIHRLGKGAVVAGRKGISKRFVGYHCRWHGRLASDGVGVSRFSFFCSAVTLPLMTREVFGLSKSW